MTRTALRATAVLGATAALTFAGAGVAAAATTHSSKVDGNTVSVTFDWAYEAGLDVGDSCGAALVEPAAALDLASAFATGNITSIFNNLIGEPGVHMLATDGVLIDSPVVVLTPLTPSATVEAEVDTGIYTLVSACTDDLRNPKINPFTIVGDPFEAVMGSVEGFSSGDGAGLDTLSAVIGGGEGEGLLDLATLSADADDA